jgi:hypothetical protein
MCFSRARTRYYWMSSPVWGQFVDHDIDHSAVGIVKFDEGGFASAL